jgi:hypothetical protein
MNHVIILYILTLFRSTFSESSFSIDEQTMNSHWQESFKLMKLKELWLTNSVQHFLWMKAKTLIQLYDRWCWSCCVSRTLKCSITCFPILAWFVVLQVIVEWLWWAGFGDGVRSWLLNGQSLWIMWIIVLGDDWCWAFKGAKGCGQCKGI